MFRIGGHLTPRPSNGWTGGQYSLFRALLGSWLVVDCAVSIAAAPGPPPAPVLGLALLGAACGLLLALGWHDRPAAVLGAAIEVAFLASSIWPLEASRVFVVWLLLAHALEPPAPYGSLAARGRLDPAGGFRVDGTVYGVTWIVVAAWYSFSGWSMLLDPGGLAGEPRAIFALLVLAPLALSRRVRPWLWLAFTLLHVLGLTVLGQVGSSVRMLLLHFMLFDPAWVRPLRSAAVETLYYDGTCGLCHRAVRFVLAEDPEGRFRFAPLPSRGPADESPDSLVVERADGARLVRSAAVLHVASRLGGVWRVLGALARVVPRALRDGLYDAVAAVRHRLFARPPAACPVATPALLRRFDVTDPGTAPRDRTTR